MKLGTIATVLALVLGSGFAWADKVVFSDGRVCSRCTVSRDASGAISSVTDRHGKQWLTPGSTVKSQDAHPIVHGFVSDVKENFKNAPSEQLQKQVPTYGSGATSGQCQSFGNGTSFCY